MAGINIVTEIPRVNVSHACVHISTKQGSSVYLVKPKCILQVYQHVSYNLNINAITILSTSRLYGLMNYRWPTHYDCALHRPLLT